MCSAAALFRNRGRDQQVMAIPGWDPTCRCGSGSSLFGARWLQRSGLPFALLPTSHRHDDGALDKSIAPGFRPSAQLNEPYVMRASNVFAG